MLILDCTLRDGGYYNRWDFPESVVATYLDAMDVAGVDIVELGMRSLINKGFKGAYAYTTDEFLETLNIPSRLTIGVMVNAAELLSHSSTQNALELLFPLKASESKVDLVRIACHAHEFEKVLPVNQWLKERGYLVGFNLMQIAERSSEDIESLAKAAANYDIDVLYFADSMGSMDPKQCKQIVKSLRSFWDGNLGIHTHDNMGKALQNTLAAMDEGVTWLDATVTGMGRGPGNAKTEELVIEVSELRKTAINIVPLMATIRTYFQPLKSKYDWGSNPFYYLSGKYGIHPTFIQEMLNDPRFSEEDILAAIEHLKTEGGARFSFDALDATRKFYKKTNEGSWSPQDLLCNKSVLILGAGPSLKEHKKGIESFIKKHSPVVIAMNTQKAIGENFIDLRIASHPIRLMADCQQHLTLPQPLITPASSLPEDVKASLENKMLYDFGLSIEEDEFDIGKTRATIPNSLVISYALAVAAAGKASQIFFAGFDGFGSGDNRTSEMLKVLNAFTKQVGMPITSITYTEYDIPSISLYGAGNG